MGIRERLGKGISAEEYRINDQIRGVQRVRLIVQIEPGKNENKGIVPFRDALRMAQDMGLDLVEIAPNEDPPVARIMDFSKFLYERSKKEREARKAQKVIEVKEIQLQLKTNEYHMGFKLKDARRWLSEGMKVKVRVRFVGREITFPELGRKLMDAVINELQDIATIEQGPSMEGRAMLMVLAPITEKPVKEAKPAKKPAPPPPPQS